MLFKRGVIESVNDILMTVFAIGHTRHRSPVNAATHAFGAILACSFYDSKPAVFNPIFLNQPLHLSKTHGSLITRYAEVGKMLCGMINNPEKFLPK